MWTAISSPGVGISECLAPSPETKALSLDLDFHDITIAGILFFSHLVAIHTQLSRLSGHIYARQKGRVGTYATRPPRPLHRATRG